MLVSDLLVSAKAILNDADAVTYTERELLEAVNLACNAVSIHRPDASSTVGEVQVGYGIQNKLPQGGLRVLDVLGESFGNVVRVVNMADLDAANPYWRTQKKQKHVKEVMIDERAPGVFWVNPPNTGEGMLEMIYSKVPDTVNEVSCPLPVTDKYAPVVLEWLLYLMFSRDSERSPNQTRAQSHKRTFFDLLGIKTQVDLALSPNAQRQK